MEIISTNAVAMTQLWINSAKLSRKIGAALGAVHGIGYTEYMVLQHLMETEHQTMRRIDLAEVLGLSASGVTRLLKPMEKIGLVEKQNNPRDARVSLVKVSDAGRVVFKDATVTANAKIEHFFQHISPKDSAQLGNILNQLRGA